MSSMRQVDCPCMKLLYLILKVECTQYNECKLRCVCCIAMVVTVVTKMLNDTTINEIVVICHYEHDERY